MPNFSLDDQVFFDAAAQFQTPFHLYTEAGIRQTARALKTAFSGVPEFREYFAVKALPTPAILRILKDEGCGVDCASMTELMLAEACGFHGGDIMFSANDVPPEEFAYARALNAHINLDDLTHVEVLEHNGGIPEEVCLRFNPGGTFRIGNTIMGSWRGQVRHDPRAAQPSAKHAQATRRQALWPAFLFKQQHHRSRLLPGACQAAVSNRLGAYAGKRPCA